MTRTFINKRAFTLIELLVVIAIIAILAAILFPVFAQARSKARQTTGLSNVKQAALSIIMYGSDYDEKWPLAGYGGKANGDACCTGADAAHAYNQYGGGEWQNTTMPYVKSAGLFESPGDASTTTGWTKGDEDFEHSDGKFSLLYNDLLSHTMQTNATTGYADQNQQDRRSTGTSYAYVNSPADCVLLIEGHGGWIKSEKGALPAIPAWNGTTDYKSKWYKEMSISGKFTAFIAPHCYSGEQTVTGLPFYSGGQNAAFCDGHAKYVRTADSSGNPVVCSTLPWTKSMDPQQRRGGETANYCGGDNPVAAPGGNGWGISSNWM